jgi:outer membrane immunogenic protein
MRQAALLLGAVGAAALFSSAFGADMYNAPGGGGYKDGPAPFTSWTGFYAGINGGGAWGDSNELIFVDGNSAITGDAGRFRNGGGFGGGQIGYNWQGVWHPLLVLGVEADIQGAGISDHFVRSASYYGTTTFDGKQDVGFFGTVRGRIGYTSGNVLVYGTGGFAYGGVNTRFQLTNAAFTNNISSNATRTGFAVGGGLEYKITPEWSIKAEYQFIDLGDEKLTNAASDGTADGTKVDTSFHTVRAGINYFLDPAYSPLK